MAREKVDNKLNVVIGTKAQIAGDTSIPENSIVIVTDDKLKADEIFYSIEKNVKEAIEDLEADKVDIVDNLNTDDATKVLSAKRGKELQDNKVPKTTTIIGLDLQDNISIGEFRTALGNATQSVAGLLSAADKTHLDGLVALLDTSDGNNVVDTIGEILAIFNNYPEGVDLLTTLQGKVDKVTGMGLSENDLTDTLKSNYDTAFNWGDHALEGYLKAITKAMVEGVLTGTITSHNHNGVYEPANSNIQNHISSTSNPHSVTKAQIGLESVDDTSDLDKPISTATQSALNNKQDKLVAGLNISIVGNTISASGGGGEGTQDISAAEVKALYEANEDTNAFTDDEKDKLSGIQAGADVNVQSDWDATSGDALILNKPSIPTKISALTNDTGYINTETDPLFTAWDKSTGISITKSQVSDLITATQSLPGLMSATDKQRLDALHALLEEDTENNVVDSINEVLAIFNNYPEGVDLVTALAGKVDKVSGKGLSTEDYTTTEKDKLSGVQAGAQVNPTGSQIKTLYESNANTNAFTDTEKSKLGNIQAGAQVNTVTSVATKTGAVVLNQDDIGDGATYKRVTDVEKTYWDEKQDKLTAGNNITINPITNVISASGEGGGGEVDLNEMAHFNYAGSIYGDKYNLLADAWQDMKNSESVLFDIPLTLAAPNQEMGGMTIDLYVGTNGQLQSLYDACVNETIPLPIDSSSHDTYYINNVATYYEGDISGVVSFPIPLYSFGSFGADDASFLIGDLTPLEMGLGLVLAKYVDISIPNNNIVIQQGFEFENENGIIIPNSVTRIGRFAFVNWTSNNQPLVIPNSVTSIERNAFMNWKANNQQLIIPNSVASIGFNAFDSWDSNNQPLVISNSVTYIEEEAFATWKANNHPLVIPDSVTNIGRSAFTLWTSNNQPLVIPDSVTSIGNGAFSYWPSNNQQLIIPSSVTSIEDYAFLEWSSNNQPLVIPFSVEYIGFNAFYNWFSVPYVEIQAITPPTLASSNAFDNQNNAPIYVPDASVTAYKAAAEWEYLADRIFPISGKDKMIVELTQAQYDALSVYDNNTYYLIVEE